MCAGLNDLRLNYQMWRSTHPHHNEDSDEEGEQFSDHDDDERWPSDIKLTKDILLNMTLPTLQNVRQQMLDAVEQFRTSSPAPSAIALQDML